MRILFFTALLLAIPIVKSFAQNPLVGAWEMISIEGTGAEGENFRIDTTTAREIKIITPTHYMLMAHNVEGDSLIFNRAYLGEVELKGNVYVERPLISSLPIFENVKSDFTWRVEGDRFIQSGTFTRPDGKTVVLDEFVFKKIARQAYPNNSAIGTWKLKSSTLTEGKSKNSPDAITGFYVVTPSHWMRFSGRNKKFESVSLGVFNNKGGKNTPTLLHAYPSINNSFTLVSEKVEGDTLIIKCSLKRDDGSEKLWEEVYHRVK